MDLQFASAVEIAEGVRTGEYDPVEVVESFLKRIEARDGETNAFVTVLEDQARERAATVRERVEAGEELPLAGVPVAMEDLHESKAGVRHTMGLAPLADNVARETSVTIRRLEAAGAVVVGTTNAPELGHSVRTTNELQGPTGTPFDPERNAGPSHPAAAPAAGRVVTQAPAVPLVAGRPVVPLPPPGPGRSVVGGCRPCRVGVRRLFLDARGVLPAVERQVREGPRHAGERVRLGLLVGEPAGRRLGDLPLDDLGRAGQTHPHATGVLLGDALLDAPRENGLLLRDGGDLPRPDELDGVVAHGASYAERREKTPDPQDESTDDARRRRQELEFSPPGLQSRS
jgi:hypothetical protein